MVAGLTIGGTAACESVAHGAPADAGAVEAPAAPVAAPAAPTPAMAPAAPAADTAVSDAPDAPAPDGNGEAVPEVDGETVFEAIRRAVETKDWAAVLAAVILILAYGFARKNLVGYIPVIGDWFATDDFGGVVGAFLSAFLGAWGTAALAGGDLFATDTLTAAWKIGIFAAGGYGGIWKKLPWVKSSGNGPDEESEHGKKKASPFSGT